MTRMWLPVVLLALAALGGCGGVRFSVDVVPTRSGFRETTILSHGRASASQTVALVDVSGLIRSDAPQQLLGRGESPLARFGEALAKAAVDRDVKAIVVRVNSRGGTVTASDAMYRELLRFREDSGKPAVILMGDVAASGGYYLACAGDHIVAPATCVTASIGVIMQRVNVSEGLARLGVHSDPVISGPNKGMGSPLQPEKPEHREIYQGMVDEFYARFVDVVRTHRAISDDVVGEVTDGRVVTGLRAAEVGLVDEVGDVHDAFRVARELAGLSSARLVRYHRSGQRVASPHAAATVNEVSLIRLENEILDPGFYYLWQPSTP